MTRAPLVLMAANTPGEAAACRLALGRLNEALSGAGGEPIALAKDAVAREVWAILPVAVEASSLDDDWPVAEARFRAHAVATSRSVSRLYLCTVFRRARRDPERRRALRFGRLNLLAIALSQELRAFVIDLDRALAAVGARASQADFRLGADVARVYAAHEIAAALLATGVEAHAPAAAAEAARETLKAWRLDLSSAERDRMVAGSSSRA